MVEDVAIGADKEVLDLVDSAILYIDTGDVDLEAVEVAAIPATLVAGTANIVVVDEVSQS